MARSKAGKGDRGALIKQLNRMRALPDSVRKRAAAGRSTKGKKLISDFKLEPPVVRVREHESARISFVPTASPRTSPHDLVPSDPGDDARRRAYRSSTWTRRPAITR